MPSIYIYRVMTKPGVLKRPIRPRFHVRMEIGRGRPVHLGVFPTEKLAKDKVQASWELLNRGVMPTKTPVIDEPPPARTMNDLVDAWLKSRIDVADRTLSHLTISSRMIKERFGALDPEAVTTEDVQDWIHEQLAHKPRPYKPSTIGLRVRTLGTILAYGKVAQNPARDPIVKKPKKRRKAHRMPTRRELDAIYANITNPAVANCVRLIEETGMRVSEAVDVRAGDWDRRNKRLLVPDSATEAEERYAKTGAAGRWIVQVDDKPAIPTFPPGTAPETRMFPGVTHQKVRSAMDRACVKAGIRRYSPHNLRDLSASTILHYGKLSLADLAVRLGHSSSAVTLSVYNHSLPPED